MQVWTPGSKDRGGHLSSVTIVDESPSSAGLSSGARVAPFWVFWPRFSANLLWPEVGKVGCLQHANSYMLPPLGSRPPGLSPRLREGQDFARAP